MSALLYDAEARGAAAARERERLQGVWHFLTGRRKVQLVIDGDRFIARFNNGDVYAGRFELDPTQKPKAMDMTIADGPDKHRGQGARCIYALDGEHLVWCPGEPGANDRPKAFPATDSMEPLCIVFRRDR